MKPKLLLIAAPVCLLFVSAAKCEWGRTAEDYIRLPLGPDPRTCSDGNGGCWVAAVPVGLCHVDRNGNLTWGYEPYGLGPGNNYDPKPVLAPNGDVILAMDRDNAMGGPQKSFIQRINLDKEHVWGERGIELDTSQRIQSVVGAYAGPVNNTYLIHWIRCDDFNGDYDTRIQLLNGNGELLWRIGGIGLNWPHTNTHFTMTSDQCIIAAQNVAPTPAIAIIKFSAEGEQVWDSRILTLWQGVAGRDISDAESDRAGGVILVYEHGRRDTVNDSVRYYRGINVLKISNRGDSLWTRLIYEREYEENDNYDMDPIINYAGSDHYFVAWADWPHAFKVVALNVDGDMLWDEPVDVITRLVGYGDLDAVDSDSGVCYVWSETDDREQECRLQQWGQRIGLGGERLWGDRGRAIQARALVNSSIATDGNGGIITVVDFGWTTIQMINKNGEIGVVLPVGVEYYFEKTEPSKLSPQMFIYPNPGNSQFRIEFDKFYQDEIFNYSIYNMVGRSVLNGRIKGVSFIVNDLSRFPSGEYILQVQSPRGTLAGLIMLVK